MSSYRMEGKSLENLARNTGGYFPAMPARRRGNDGKWYWLAYAHYTSFSDGWWNSTHNRTWAAFRLSDGSQTPSAAFGSQPLTSALPRLSQLHPVSTLKVEWYPDDRVDNFGHPPGVSWAARGGVARHIDGPGVKPAGGHVLMADGSVLWQTRLVQAPSLWHAAYWSALEEPGPKNPVN